MSFSIQASTQERVRIVDVEASRLGDHANAIEEMYDDELDVILIRDAFDRATLAALGDQVARADSGLDWVRPNPPEMEGEDIRVLGLPLTPSGKTPSGPTLDAYLDSATSYRSAVDRLFDAAGFDPRRQFEKVLGALSGGRPVGPPQTGDGRAYAPYTVRLLRDGQGIGVHHDYHFDLPACKELAAGLDTRMSLSFFAPLGVPEAGGELYVYALTLENPDKPSRADGRWDADVIGERFHHLRLTPRVGDLIVFASGRCLHQVTPVVGPAPRITLGGFLAFDRERTRAEYWS
jgi:hypothetical protein